MKARIVLLLAALVVLLCVATQANADGVLTYTESDTATGSIGGTSFTGALVTITFVGHTANVTGSPGFFQNIVGTGTVTIAGIGTFAFTPSTTPTDVFDNQVTQVAGIASFLSILDTVAPAFATYDLTTPIGPISGPALTNLGIAFDTTDGPFILNSVGSNSTFTATTPEPGSLFLLLFGTFLAGLLTVRRRQPASF